MLTFFYTIENEPTDKEFMVELYMEFERLLFYTASKYVSNPNVIEDIVQESLLKLQKKINTIRPMCHRTLAAYVRSTVRNTAINFLKEMGNDNFLIADIKDESILIVDQDIVLNEVMDISRYRDLIAKLWPQLSNEERVLLEGKYIYGYTDAELGRELGCKADSIRMKLTRARRHALKILHEQEGVLHFDEA